MDIEWADLLLLPRLLQSKLGYRQTYFVPLCTSLSLELSSEQFQYTLQLSTKVKVYIRQELRLDFLQVLVDRENVTRLTPSPTSGGDPDQTHLLYSPIQLLIVAFINEKITLLSQFTNLLFNHDAT